MSRTDAKLRQRIYVAAFKREEGDETLYQIADEQGVSRPQMYNHVKRHVTQNAISDTTKELSTEKKVIEMKAKAHKEQELAIEGDVIDGIEARPEQIIALDTYISQGYDDLKKGKFKVTGNGLLAAIKIKNEWENKRQQNKTDYLKTIYAIASDNRKETEQTQEKRDTHGQPEQPNQPEQSVGTETVTGLDRDGAEPSRSLYHQVAGSEPA